MAELDAATEPFGVSYDVRTLDDGTIEVEHSPFLYAVDDQGELVLSWQFGAESADIANDLDLLLDQIRRMMLRRQLAVAVVVGVLGVGGVSACSSDGDATGPGFAATEVDGAATYEYTIPEGAVVPLVAGIWQYPSLPAETGPRPVWWLLPTFAVVATTVAALAERRGTAFAVRAATLVVGGVALHRFLLLDPLRPPTAPSRSRPGMRSRSGSGPGCDGQRFQGATGLTAPSPPVRTSGAPSVTRIVCSN